MSKGKMLAISMLITACFVSLAAVLIFFLSDEGFKKIKQAKAENELQIAMAQKQEQEVPVEEEIGYLQQGFDLVETNDAIHDVIFDYDTPNITMENGPMDVKVTNVRLEVVQPVSEKMKKKLEGMNKVTVVRLQVEATNISNETVNFDLSTLTVGSDVGEKSRIDQVLSDKLPTVYQPGEKKAGEIVILFESKPDLLATIWLNVRSPFNEAGDELGENTKLKVKLFK